MSGNGASNLIQSVFFDMGGTLLRVKSSVGAVYAERARAHGFGVSAEELERDFEAAWWRSAQRGRDRGYRVSDAGLRDEWIQIVRETYGPRIPASRFAPLFEDLYRCFSTAHAWALADGARETLAHLRSLGLRLGVLSNWDSRLLALLDELRIREAFDFHVVSFDVGHEKPHPAIFEEAMRRARTRPEQSLHVGDSYEADIEPARRLGMHTLWIAPAAHRAQRVDAGPGAEWKPEISRDPVGFWDGLLRGLDLSGGSNPRPDGPAM